MTKKHEKELQALADEHGFELAPINTRHFSYAFKRDGQIVARTGRASGDPRSYRNLKATLSRAARKTQTAPEAAVVEVNGVKPVEAEVEDSKIRRNSSTEAFYLTELSKKLGDMNKVQELLGVQRNTLLNALNKNRASYPLEAAARMALEKMELEEQITKLGSVERDAVQLLEENEVLEKKIAALREELSEKSKAAPEKKDKVFVVRVPEDEVEWLRSTLPRIGAALLHEV